MGQLESFPLISGHLSLDLVNTELVRRGTKHDLLVNVADLDRWIEEMKQSGSLHPLSVPSTYDTPEVLRNLRELRASLRNAFLRITEGISPESDFVHTMERLVASAPLSYQLNEDNLVAIPVGTPDAAIASLVALDVLQLLASGALLTLRRCANPDCVLLFLDASGKRKWCSMKICGNRAKVARHEHKRKKSPNQNMDIDA